jgi:hypothetical protein
MKDPIRVAREIRKQNAITTAIRTVGSDEEEAIKSTLAEIEKNMAEIDRLIKAKADEVEGLRDPVESVVDLTGSARRKAPNPRICDEATSSLEILTKRQQSLQLLRAKKQLQLSKVVRDHADDVNQYLPKIEAEKIEGAIRNSRAGLWELILGFGTWVWKF